MSRYVKLYGHFIAFSLSKAMEFRFDFLFRIFMDVIFYTTNILFFKVIFLHTDSLAGWTEPQVIVFIAGCLVADSIMMTVFTNNLWWLAIYVNRGDLDYYLVRPVSTLFFISFRDFAANSLINFFMALGILVWALKSYPDPLSAGSIAVYCLLILNGVFIHYLVRLGFLLPVFWTHSSRGLESMYLTMEQLAEKPDPIFKGWVRALLTTVLPFGVMYSFPARILFGQDPWSFFTHIVAVTAGLALIVFTFWFRGLKVYTSASS